MGDDGSPRTIISPQAGTKKLLPSCYYMVDDDQDDFVHNLSEICTEQNDMNEI